MNGEKRLNLTAKEILEKDFKQGFRGYDQDEVDKFLDLIIKDYENFQKNLTKSFRKTTDFEKKFRILLNRQEEFLLHQ